MAFPCTQKKTDGLPPALLFFYPRNTQIPLFLFFATYRIRTGFAPFSPQLIPISFHATSPPHSLAALSHSSRTSSASRDPGTSCKRVAACSHISFPRFNLPCAECVRAGDETPGTATFVSYTDLTQKVPKYWIVHKNFIFHAVIVVILFRR